MPIAHLLSVARVTALRDALTSKPITRTVHGQNELRRQQLVEPSSPRVYLSIGRYLDPTPVEAPRWLAKAISIIYTPVVRTTNGKQTTMQVTTRRAISKAPNERYSNRFDARPN